MADLEHGLMGGGEAATAREPLLPPEDAPEPGPRHAIASKLTSKLRRQGTIAPDGTKEYARLKPKDILERLDAAETWMVTSLDKTWVRCFWGFDPAEIVKGNFKILKDHFTAEVQRKQRKNSDPSTRKKRRVQGKKRKNSDQSAKSAWKRSKYMIEDLIVGPAVPYAFKCNAITWVCFLGLCWMVPHILRFEGSFDVHGIAEPPGGNWRYACIALWLVATVFTLRFEFIAALYVVPTQFMYRDNRKLFGCLNVPFTVWIGVHLFLSFFLHTDIYTTAIFIGRVWASHEVCNVLQQQWSWALQRAAFVPAFLDDVYFAYATVFVGSIMFAQVLYALAYSIPWSPDMSDYAPLPVKKPTMRRNMLIEYKPVEQGVQYTAVYDTFLRKLAGHGRCCAALAESGRMMCLNFNDDEYLNEAERDWDCIRVHAEMMRANTRFIMFLLQSILVANLQITFLGIKKHVNNGKADWFTLASVALTVASMLKYMIYELNASIRHNDFCTRATEEQERYAKTVEEEMQKLDRKAQTRLLSASKIKWEATRTEAKRRRGSCCNRCTFVVAIFLLAHAMLKASMTMVLCGHGYATWSVPPMSASLLESGGLMPFLHSGCFEASNASNTNCSAQIHQHIHNLSIDDFFR